MYVAIGLACAYEASGAMLWFWVVYAAQGVYQWFLLYRTRRRQNAPDRALADVFD